MNILLVNHYAGSPRHGMEYRPYYLAREWVRQGHTVTIVAASESHVRSRAPEMTGDLTETAIDGISYLWLRTPPYRGNGARRVLNMFTFIYKLFRHRGRLCGPRRPDAVIASSTYPLDIYPARAIAKAAGAKLVFEVHDLWPLSPIELGNISPRHPFIMLLQHAEEYAYRHADRVVSMLPNAKDHMVGHGMSPEKFVYIPNGIDAGEWAAGETILPPDEHRRILEPIRKEGLFTVCYAGAHGIANNLEIFVRAGRYLRETPVRLVLVGQGPEKEALERIAREEGLGNIVFLPPVPKAAIPSLFRFMDAMYIGLKKEPLFRFGVSPNKLMDYMMAAKPVLYAIDAGNNLVAESGCGISLTEFTPATVAAGVKRLIGLSPAERSVMGLNGRRYIEAHHEYRALATRFLEVLQ